MVELPGPPLPALRLNKKSRVHPDGKALSSKKLYINISAKMPQWMNKSS